MKEFIFSLRVEVLCCVCLYLVFDLEKKIHISLSSQQKQLALSENVSGETNILLALYVVHVC